jgi:Sel1 repeat-containing protein
MRLLGTGKIDQFMTALRAIAEKGNVKAQIILGHAYDHENVIVKQVDYSEAMKWYKRASAQNSGEGSVGVAELYEKGLSVPKSPEEARVWWELAAKQGYDQQDLDVRCFTRVPSDEPLTCTPWNDGTGCPTESEMEALGASGVTGLLTPTGGGGGRHRFGPKARAIIVLDHPIPAEERLKQPRHTNVIYVQSGSGWELLPKDASVLDRFIVLSPQPDGPRYIMAGVQDVDGSISAGGCASWK